VGIVSWGRTRAVRLGEPVSRAKAAAHRRTSATTWLAAASASALAGAALAGTSGRPTPVRAVAVLGCALIAVSGLLERVSDVWVAPGELVVRRAGLGLRRARWAEVLDLTPPRTPLGAWRIRSGGSTISLMPSDLLDGELLLWAVVRRAGLVFDGRRWRRPHAGSSASP